MRLLLVRRILSGASALLILLAVVSYGSVETEAYASLALAMNAVLFVAVTVFGLPFRVRPVILFSLALVIVVTAWVLLQTSPLPGSLFADPSWKALNQPSPAVMSVSPGDDGIALLKFFLPISGFLATLILFDTDERSLAFLKLLVMGAALIAAFGLLQFFEAPDALLFGEKRFYRDSFTGSFVNRNTAATFFATALLASIALTLRKALRVSPTVFKRLWSSLAPLPAGMRSTLASLGVNLFLALLLLVALVLTKSRAGIGSFLIALIVFALLRFRNGHGIRTMEPARSGPPWRRGLAAVGLLLATILSLNLILGQVLLRAELATTTDPRFCVIPSILAAIVDHLPTGAGLASFRPVFPAYRDPSCGIEFVWDMAHNLYLEGLVSLGVLFPVVALLTALALVRIFVIGMRTRRRYRFAPQLGIAVFVLVVLHSALDFSLQIPGYSLYLAAVFGCLVTISAGGARRGEAARE